MTSKHTIKEISTMTQKGQNALGPRRGTPTEVWRSLGRFSGRSDIRNKNGMSYPGRAVEKGMGRGVAIFEEERK